jgi:hypothetical protein
MPSSTHAIIVVATSLALMTTQAVDKFLHWLSPADCAGVCARQPLPGAGGGVNQCHVWGPVHHHQQDSAAAAGPWAGSAARELCC